MSSCSICLSVFQEPVSIPCGHIYCSACLLEYIGTQRDMYTASCPTCRASFPIVIPELALIPKQFHHFFVPGIRRVYMDLSLHHKLSTAQEQVKVLENQCDTLMAECERHIALSKAHSEGEQACQKKLKDYEAELKENNLEIYRMQRIVSQERKKATDAARETLMMRERYRELEEELESYRQQRQEDLDTILEMDDLKRSLAEEKRTSKQTKREADVWKGKYNESQEQLELYESKLTRPRFAKRNLSDDSFSSELLDFDEAILDETPPRSSPKPQKLSSAINAHRPILPPPRKKLKPLIPSKNSHSAATKEEQNDYNFLISDTEGEVEAASLGSYPPPRLRLSRTYRLPPSLHTSRT